MPTFTAIALDRYLEPEATSMTTTTKTKNTTTNGKTNLLEGSRRLERRNSTPIQIENETPTAAITTTAFPPPHPPQLRRGNSARSPALYTTPESTPLPESPTASFSLTSPYVINHKRRGPRLVKSFSEQNVVGKGDGGDVEERTFSEEEVVVKREEEERERDGENWEGVVGGNGSDGELRVLVGASLERESGTGGEGEDFYDLQDSMSFTSNTDGEEFYSAADRSARLYASPGEFYDAAEELSSDSGRLPHRSLFDLELEMREMRTSLLMEIEKRKQAEDALNNMRNRWHIMREKLGTVGLVLQQDFPASLEDSQSDADLTDEICRQILVTRFVSEAIGRGMAKAEAEAEMETQLEVKNFEIARICDRLHYYETMNKEMSQRNQEAIEIARSQRQTRRKRQKWIWGSIAAAITLGSSALAWSYIPSGKGSSMPSSSEASNSDSGAH